ncbi:hypothetical protein Hanom_Chr01g00082911 [Helianthus anomalus]
MHRRYRPNLGGRHLIIYRRISWERELERALARALNLALTVTRLLGKIRIRLEEEVFYMELGPGFPTY